MKDFMFIFRNQADGSRPTPEEMQANMQLWIKWVENLQSRGIYVAGEPLMSPGRTVRGKQPTVTDGPFAESKEIVGGFFIVKADNLDEATEISKDCPDLQGTGSVEIREVMKM